ncbi:Single-stranded DNA binding protein [Halococcoides cellulosivorans]|uniref:Replication factor A n=1 Tax=Halococcoides cellulosivorans TaxID=1679096 RepID=A0A2R4WZT3_9EURY|nr:Single-stranded DNA binding protein [Halococcoides cellulosivorans]AWB27066.1 replication factor A [Halococcoides cellulosivorans]
MDLEAEARDLADGLDADQAAIEQDLENLISYSVPLDEAKQSLRRKYGSGDRSGAPEPVSIDDVSPEDGSVTVSGVILRIGKRSIRYQGEDQVIREGQIADETGRIAFTAWDDIGLTAGDAVELGNAGVREWEGEPELNVGESTQVSAIDPIDVPYDVGGEADLVDLEPGDRGVIVEARVEECERRTIDGRDGETEILSGVLADETARLPFTDWDPHDAIGEGETVRVTDVFVREFRGAPSVNVSEYATVETASGVTPIEDAPERTLREARASGGQFDVAVIGHVLELRDGSGLIERCPDCNRVIQSGQCREHGAVEGVDDLRVRAVFDDGTDSATVVLDSDLTERVYGGDVEDAKDAAREAMDQSVVAEHIAQRIVGREYRVRGTLSVDEYGVTLTADELTENDADPAALARAALQEVGT